MRCWSTLFSLLIVCAVFSTTVAPARGEVPLLTPKELQQHAHHIVTGHVRNVYTTNKRRNRQHIDTLYAVEVVVTGVEKGQGIAADQVIFAKAWRMKKRERGWAGPSGQDVIPKRGQLVKLYLTGANGGYDALSPNGIHVVKRKKK